MAYGVAFGTHVPLSFFQVNQVQSSEPVLTVQSIFRLEGATSVSFHILNGEIGQIFWVSDKEVLHTRPVSARPEKWTLEATDKDHLANFAAAYTTRRGLYVAQFDQLAKNTVHLALMSPSDNVSSSLSLYISMTMVTTAADGGEITGKVSVNALDSGIDSVTIAVNYIREGDNGAPTSDIFNLSILHETNQISSSQPRLSLYYKNTLAVNTFADGTVYAFAQSTQDDG